MKGRLPIYRYLVVVLVITMLTVSSAGCARKGGNNATPSAEVPSEYKTLYNGLKADLDAYDTYLNSHDSGKQYPVIYAAELLPANANRGEDLLKPGTMKGVTTYLDSLQEMGVRGVTIAIHYPIYTPRDPHYQEYAAFYKQVAEEVQRRNMKMDVETSVLFANTPFSSSTFNIGEIPFETYKAEDRQMVAAIIDDLHPDYLNLGAEPDTGYKLSGYEEMNDPRQYADFVNYLLDGLDRGKTKISAGIGSWGNIEYVEELASRTSLDCISIHLYPVFGNCLENAITIADLAHQYNKSVVLDEAWLYKTDTPAAQSIAANEEVFRRDAYSFWAPLDQQFLALLVKTARIHNIEYISPFWANFFFGYADYGPATMGLSYADLTAVANREAVKNILADRLTPTGEYYKMLIGENQWA